MNYIKTGIGMDTKNRRKHTKGITTVILILVIIVLSFSLYKTKIPVVSNISSSIVGFFDSIGKTISGVFKEGFGFFGNVKKLRAEKGKLELDKKDLDFKLLEVERLKIENNSLREKIGIKEKYSHFNLQYADVSIRSYSSWNETFEINKGKNQGIKDKQTVVAAEGLVGYISSVEDNTSTVTTILDPNAAVSIEIASINKIALVKGDFELKKQGNLKLLYIPIDTEVSITDAVYTSGIGGVYPKGIPVGTIIKVINKKNEIDRYAVVKPAMDIGSIKSVAIIVD